MGSPERPSPPTVGGRPPSPHPQVVAELILKARPAPRPTLVKTSHLPGGAEGEDRS